MQHALIPRRDPPNQPVRPPMVYVEKPPKWEYKQVVRNFEKEPLLDEAESDALGEKGWEMTGIVQQPPLISYYFKRLLDT